MTYTEIIKRHAAEWADMNHHEVADIVGCPPGTANLLMHNAGIEHKGRDHRIRSLDHVNTARYNSDELAKMSGLNRKYIMSELSRRGREYKPTSGHMFLTGRKGDHCERYAELKCGKSFMTVTQCYHNEKSSVELGKLWGLTGNTIRNWVRAEGGRMRQKGGSRPRSGRKQPGKTRGNS